MAAKNEAEFESNMLVQRKKSRKEIDFDSVLSKCNDWGLYQILIYLILCVPASLPTAWTAFNQVFVAAVPQHWCAIPELNNSNVEEKRQKAIPQETIGGIRSYSQCEQYNITQLINNVNNPDKIPCQNGWEFNRSTYDSTIATEYNLVCDLSFWVSLCTMIFYMGSFIGNILFGYIADKWGRRVSFFAILTVQVVFGTANAFAPNIYLFVVFRFIVGLTFPALYQIPFIISLEIIGPSKRIFAGVAVCVFFGSAMSILGIIASFIRQWSLLTIVCNTPFVVLFVYWFFLPESPRWLVTVCKLEEASKMLARVAKVNGRDVEKSQIKNELIYVYQKGRSESAEENRHNLLDLFKTPNLRKKTIILTYIWLVNAVVYNGLTLNSNNLPVDDYLSFTINGAVEIPAYFIIWPLLNRIGRRWPLCVSMLLGGAACISTMFIAPERTWVISGLAFFGKFGIAASFAIIYIFAGELYPTVMRALGMGMSSMVAGSGLILGPYLVSLGSYVRILPLLIMGSMTITAGIASMFLPETLGSNLPQTMEEAEEFGKNFPFCYCSTSGFEENEIEEDLELIETHNNHHKGF